MLSTKNQAQFKELVNSAVRGGASDVHFSVGALPIMRIDGGLRVITEDIVITTEFVEELAMHLAGMDGREVNDKEELFFAVNLDPGFRVKVTIYYQKGLPAVTLRFIPIKIQTLEQLHLPTSIEAFTEHKKGLVIVTGSYGTGKTSVIASLIQSINSKLKRYIVTLEKPIEFMFTSQLSIIEQREIGKDTESFERALSYLNHEDVDVVVLSGLDSEATIIAALELARGNALVFVAFEASSIRGAIEKIRNMVSPETRKYADSLLSEALLGAVSLKLIPKIGGGLVPAVETLFTNEPVEAALAKGDLISLENIMVTGSSQGMITFDRSLVDLVKQHQITSEDAKAFADDPITLSRLLGVRMTK